MDKLGIMLWLNTAVAILGTFLNTKQIRFGFVLWTITNAVFVGANLYLKIYPQAALFSVYFGLAIYGWYSWGRAAKKKAAKAAIDAS